MTIAGPLPPLMLLVMLAGGRSIDLRSLPAGKSDPQRA
jgi:hypothetical protein